MNSPAAAGSVRRRWLSAGLALLVLVQAASAWADLSGPRPHDRHVAVIVTTLLPKEHLSRHPLDQEISKRMLRLYLKALDPMKMYFSQSDVDQLSQRENELVDRARKGDVTMAYGVFRVFLARMDQQVQLVDELLKATPDFSAQEEMNIDYDHMSYASNQAELVDRWRKRVKYELLSLKSDKEKPLSGQAAVEKLSRRYHSLAKRTHQTDADELLEMYLSSMTSAFDPHTSYMSPSTLDNFDILMRLDLEGIGASLQFVDGYTVVHKLIPGGAAERDHRLKVEDKIVGVGQGADGELVDVVDMKLSDVVKLIRGKRNTVVRLQVVSGNSPERKIYNITREKVELKDSEARAQIFEQGRRADGRPYRVGVIKLPSFYMDMNGARQGKSDFRSTTRDVHKILEDFKAQAVDSVVLDLRGNGGGSLTEAINLTGLFIGHGPVVQVKGADGRVVPYEDQDRETTWGGPLVVVIDKFAASASEILAGAIQDYRRGLVIGDPTTHGKGTVQSLMDLSQQLFRLPNAPSLGALKITVQQFYRPCGDSTQKRGVLSDIILPSITAHMDVGEGDLEYALPFDRVQPAAYRDYGLVNKQLVDELSSRSSQRCAQSPDFQKMQRKIARYLARKQDKKVTLNEQKFVEERAEFNADKEEEKIHNPDTKMTIDRDYYLNEVLAISQDYMEAFGQPGGTPTLAGPPAVLQVTQ